MRSSELTSYLLAAGYQEGVSAGSAGQYHVSNSTVEIRPSADSYFRDGNALRVSFSGSEISHISARTRRGNQRGHGYGPLVAGRAFQQAGL
jgi:hypothetical protein